MRGQVVGPYAGPKSYDRLVRTQTRHPRVRPRLGPIAVARAKAAGPHRLFHSLTASIQSQTFDTRVTVRIAGAGAKSVDARKVDL
jgi:hypothetical protein